MYYGGEYDMQEQSQSLTVMEERLHDLRKRIMTLEWDKSHNQLNSSMELKYAQIKSEYESLEKAVSGIKAELKEQSEPAAGAIAKESKAA